LEVCEVDYLCNVPLDQVTRLPSRLWTLFLFTLTPEGPRVFFSKNAPNLPFLAQEAQMNFFSLFCTFNHRILH
jgi:hypothetical protein